MARVKKKARVRVRPRAVVAAKTAAAGPAGAEPLNEKDHREAFDQQHFHQIRQMSLAVAPDAEPPQPGA